jgi:hypothetical protein
MLKVYFKLETNREIQLEKSLTVFTAQLCKVN